MSFVACGAEPEILVAVEKRGDVFLVDATLAIPVPLRIAWGVLTDFDNMVGILSNLTFSRIIRRKGNSVFVMQEGTARYGIFSYAFASVREVQLEPMKRILAIQLTGNAKRFESEMELSETSKGTHLRYRARGGSGSASTRVQRLILRQLDVLMLDTLNRLSGGRVINRMSGSKLNLFHKVYGSESLYNNLRSGVPASRIVAGWSGWVDSFRNARQRHRLYA